MRTRNRYQQGSLEKQVRAGGDLVWVFRYRITDAEGKRVQRKRLVGTIKEIPNESAAMKAVDLLRCEINQDAPQLSGRRTFGMLIDHYTNHELSEDNPGQLAWSTRASYKSYLKTWIKPAWGDYSLGHVKTLTVERWLRGLHLADGTKKKLRDIMSALYVHGIRQEWLPMGNNPMRYVRCSGKRSKIPDILTIEELCLLWTSAAPRERAAIALAFGNGLRVSEGFGLKIEDVDLERKLALVNKGIVKGHLGHGKTEASKRAVPLSDYQIADFEAWLSMAPYNEPRDWLFASEFTKGVRPYWNSEILRDHIRPLAKRLGISKVIGWHTFRRTFSTLLKANGEDVKVVQELMRHGNPITTMRDYTQAIPQHLRDAQNKVVEMVLKAKAPGGESQVLLTVP